MKKRILQVKDLNVSFPTSTEHFHAVKGVSFELKQGETLALVGESGSGKELLAKAIHHASPRHQGPFVAVNCAAVPEGLFESELFGHAKGAFSGAAQAHQGLFQAANGGTLFLDEIGNLSLSMQVKLLSALQNRSVIKLGSNTPVPIDIRLISATNKDLKSMILNGLFREDLLYRINTITIELPPLRERENDVLLLAEFYLRKYSDKYDKQGLKITQKAYQKLLNYSWPGNVRELQHSIEKAVILADDKILGEFSFTLIDNNSSPDLDLKNKTIEEMEKVMILNSIKMEKGNMSIVAKNLGITRQTLYNKLKRYGI